MKMAIIGYGGMGNNHKKYIIQRLNDSDYPEKLEIAGIYDIPRRETSLLVRLDYILFPARTRFGTIRT